MVRTNFGKYLLDKSQITSKVKKCPREAKFMISHVKHRGDA